MARLKQTLCKSVEELMAYYFPKVSASEKREQKQADEALRRTAGQEKASIRLRGKKQTNNVSLFLDQYTGKDEKRVYEYLKLYLNIETSAAVKDANRATMAVAERILSERKDDLLLKGIGITKQTASKKIHDFLDELADKALNKKNEVSKANGEDMKTANKRNKRSTYYILKGLAKHLDIYAPDATFKQVDLDFVLGFLEYLKTAKNFNFKRNKDKSLDTDVIISENHRLHMYRAFNNMLNEAVREHHLQANPCPMLRDNEKPHEELGKRNFLDADEVKLLMNTECDTPEMKRAFLFCCFVGLRFSDVITLTWGEISKDKQGDLVLNKKMQKTQKTLEDLPIIAPAHKWLGDKGSATDADFVFHLGDNETTNNQLKRWVKSAGITKKITFHCSRHTAATLALSYGCPIAVVMKLLGHTKPDMTMRYAKMLEDQMKAELNKICENF